MIVVVGACVVIAILAVALWPGEREPEYHGKKLSLWLEQARSKPFLGTSETAAMAVRQIGTNGLPWMLKWLGYERPRWKEPALHIYVKLPGKWRSQSTEEWLANTGAGKRMVVQDGFEVLGKDGAPAVPVLVKFLRMHKSQSHDQAVIYCLGAIGPGAREAVPDLLMVTTNWESSLAKDVILATNRIEGAVRWEPDVFSKQPSSQRFPVWNGRLGE